MQVQLETSCLRANQLQKTYVTRRVVKDVSIEVNSGEVVGLLGPNGAGKTTCFYMIVGLVAVDGGDIYLNEQCLTHQPIHQRAKLGVSYLPQEASIFRKMTVRENILAVLELQKTPQGKPYNQSELKQQLQTLLEDLQITHIEDSPAMALSGGERRRVEIARALATNPRFVLLDEPFAGVDPIAVGEIQKIVNFLKARNIGVLITDHNVRETLNICERAYIINAGEVLASGPPAHIIEHPGVRQYYLGENFKM